MSLFFEEEISCPKCKHKQKMKIWQSLNVTDNTTLRERLFNAEINVFKCESCGSGAFLAVPLLYNDVERKFCVQFYPYDSLKQKTFCDRFTIEGKFKIEKLPEKIAKSGNYLLEPHIVFDLDEMLRYIQFREKLYNELTKRNGK